MKPVTVVIAGSRACPPGQAARVLVRFLAALPDGSTILLRRGLFTQPNLFEVQVEQVVDLIGLQLEWCQPVIDHRVFGDSRLYETGKEPRDIPAPRVGRQIVWQRDEEMVARADLVLTFITPDQIGDDSSGTVALAEKAMRLNIPVYTFAMHEYGEDGPIVLERVGEHDPKNRWAKLVPQAS